MKTPLIALALALLSGSALAATIPVTPATLATQLAKPPADDVLQLAPGLYGDVTVRRGHVTLQGPPEAVFRSVTVLGPATTLDGFSDVLTPDAGTASSTGAIRVVSASGVTIRNLHIRCGLATFGVSPDSDPALPRLGDNVLGLPTGRGISLDRADGASVTGVEISQCHRGIVVANSAKATISGNHIHDLRNTFIDGGNDPGLTIAGNWLEASRPWKLGGHGDHGDYIHIWTQPANQNTPTDGVTITNNTMLQGAGAGIMGIYLDDNHNGLGFTHATIAGNMLYGANGQGLLLERTQGAVNDNVLLEASGDPAHDAPSMKAIDGSAVSFQRNVAHDIAGTLAAQPAVNGNLIVPAAVQPAWVVEMARRLIQARGVNP